MLVQVWSPPSDNPDFELLWVIIQSYRREVIVVALYRLPKPIYQPDQLLCYIERSFDALMIKSPSALVFLPVTNSLDCDDIISRTGMMSVDNQPTRNANILYRIFVIELCYDGFKVVGSAVKSDHKVVMAYNGPKPTNVTQSNVRRRSSAARCFSCASLPLGDRDL